MVVFDSIGKVQIGIIDHRLTKCGVRIRPHNLAMSIMDDGVIVDIMMYRSMLAAKDARPAYEFMHSMGSRPTVKDGFEHVGLDVGEERGGREFHKEIGPVVVGEGGRGRDTKDPHGSELQVVASYVLLGLGEHGFIDASLGFG